MTQVVPAVDSYASAILEYKTALAKYFPGEPPDYVSLEGYVDGTCYWRDRSALVLSPTPTSWSTVWKACTISTGLGRRPDQLQPKRAPGLAQSLGHPTR